MDRLFSPVFSRKEIFFAQLPHSLKAAKQSARLGTRSSRFFALKMRPAACRQGTQKIFSLKAEKKFLCSQSALDGSAHAGRLKKARKRPTDREAAKPRNASLCHTAKS